MSKDTRPPQKQKQRHFPEIFQPLQQNKTHWGKKKKYTREDQHHLDMISRSALSIHTVSSSLAVVFSSLHSITIAPSFHHHRTFILTFRSDTSYCETSPLASSNSESHHQNTNRTWIPLIVLLLTLPLSPFLHHRPKNQTPNLLSVVRKW